MGSCAALQQVDFLGCKERDGIIANDRFISYYQVESLLYSYPKVYEAGVVSKSSKDENEILKIVLVLDELFHTEEEKQSYCQEVEGFIRKSFQFQMPINVFVRDKLPMTRSGKILRSLLLEF